MRLKLAGAAIAAMVASVPAGAATIVQTDSFYAQAGLFQRFDPALGMLNFVRYDVDFTGYRLGAIIGALPSGVPNQIPVSYKVDGQAVYRLIADGQAQASFVVPIAGSGSTVVNYPEFFDITVSGNKTFFIDPNLVLARASNTSDSFDALNKLQIRGGDSGLFDPASDTTFSSPFPVDIIGLGGACGRGGALSGPYTCTVQNYKLTYDFTPSTPAVPEPTTWAMMLLGFVAVGYSMRRRQKATSRVAYAV